MRRPTAPRIAGFPYRGLHRYFLTICTERRARVFVATPVVEALKAQLLSTSAHERFAVIAYCFMPDHVHLLIEGLADDSDMRRFVQRFKQLSAYAWRQQAGTVLWQRGYFEHTLRGDEDVLGVARYLIANPLRAGLVQNVLEYPFIGSQVIELRELLYGVQM